MDITALYALFKSSKGIVTDTRNTVSKKIYFALKGDNFDGHAFIGKAIENGASKLVIGRSISQAIDPNKALQEIFKSINFG